MIDQSRRPGILRANAYFLIAGAGLVLLGFVSPLIISLINKSGIGFSQAELLLILDGVYYLPFLLVPLGIYMYKGGGEGIKTGPVSGGQMILCMLLAYLCVMLANAISGLWSTLLDAVGFQLYTVDIDMNGTSDLIKCIFAMAVMPGICEELLFRGTVLSAYERCGTRKAILISGVLFAMLHGSVQGFPVQFMIGIVLGYLVCYTGSIYTGMMVHTAYNAFILIITYMSADRTAETAEVIDYFSSWMLVTVWLIEAVIIALIIWAIMKSFAKKASENGITLYPTARISMNLSAKLVLISGIVTVCYLYMEDILSLMGY